MGGPQGSPGEWELSAAWVAGEAIMDPKTTSRTHAACPTFEGLGSGPQGLMLSEGSMNAIYSALTVPA